MNRSKLTLALATAAVGCALITNPAAAQSLPTVAVGYADLDLSSPAGVAALNRRIGTAATQLCAGHRIVPGRWGPLNFQRCFNGALASARPQVDQVVARVNGAQMAGRTTITVRGR